MSLYTKDLIKNLAESESIILSIVIISKGIVNGNNIFPSNSAIISSSGSGTLSYNNIILLNITYTDSYLQNLSNRFKSLYNQLNAEHIFPISIWKNDIKKTNKSTGNINRKIYNYFDNNDKIENYRINILIDNIKQNIPKQNYIMSPKVIEFFTNLCTDMNLTEIYYSEWINIFKPQKSIDTQNTKYNNEYSELIAYIEKKYKISDLFVIQDSKFGLLKEQIKYFRQYGIDYKNNISDNNKKRKYCVKELNLELDLNDNINNDFDIGNNNNITTEENIDFNFDFDFDF